MGKRRWWVAALLATAGAALGQFDPRIEAGTGRDVRTWPPARHFDHIHLRLDITIPDMNRPRWHALETLTVKAIGSERRELVLDCNGPQINQVRVGGTAATFRQIGRRLVITMPEPVLAGEQVEVVIDYDLDYANGSTFGGLYWSGGRQSADPNEAWAQMHTQGQPESNHTWFPCHDFPNERLTTEVVVNIEAGYQVISNGRLLSGKGDGPDPAGNGREVWHWLQDKPHAAYLVTLVVGKFEVVDLGGPRSARPGLPIRVWAPLGKAKNCAEVFADTPAMIAAFERILDEPYPWDKYDQVIPRAYTSGAMENTSASTFYIYAANATRDSQADIIAHELFHQWTGDLITCKSWEHIWLNEGWASYGEALWMEELARLEGRDPREAYLEEIAEDLGSQRGNRGRNFDAPALVSNRYTQPFEVFMKLDNPYPKGSLILHMLREGLGDDVFFRGVRLYIDRFKFKEVETDDFRRCMEEVSGQSLERFFAQWAYRPGIPLLNVAAQWDDRAGELVVTVEQKQTIDEDNPAYEFTLPIYIEIDGDHDRWEWVRVEGRSASGRFACSAPPVDVLIDPGMSVAAHTRVTKKLPQGAGNRQTASAGGDR